MLSTTCRLCLLLFIVIANDAATAADSLLIFNTTPKDVKVYIDGKYKGKADEILTLDINAGIYSIKIEKKWGIFHSTISRFQRRYS